MGKVFRRNYWFRNEDCVYSWEMKAFLMISGIYHFFIWYFPCCGQLLTKMNHNKECNPHQSYCFLYFWNVNWSSFICILLYYLVIFHLRLHVKFSLYIQISKSISISFSTFVEFFLSFSEFKGQNNILKCTLTKWFPPFSVRFPSLSDYQWSV